MGKAYIKAISYYLPEKVVTNTEIAELFPDWSAEKVASKIGVIERHISAPDETSLDMAEKAALSLIKRHDIDKDDIDFVLLCTQSPDYFLPTSACILQDRLGLPLTCGALDFNLGCSGYIYGLALAKGLLSSGTANNILLVTSETYSKFIHEKDKGNRTIFGDAATATLVSKSGYMEIMEFDLGTDGSGAENLIVKRGGMRNRNSAGNLQFDDAGNPQSEDHLYMNGSEIFNFTLEFIPKLVYKTLEKNNMEFDNIDLFVFHQVNKYMLEFLRKKLKIPHDKFVYHMEHVGNTVSSTIPIALAELDKSSLPRHLLLAGFGVGLSWGGVILNSCENI
ncbi:MAG: ketoacyl-ACP synthase III [Alistipes sp.]|nr:ketoacyl-ACP synthase III [Alistipes sp.]